MSDLQCAARILLARTRDVVPEGQRFAASYDAPVDLDELADLHRGETVLVVGEHGHEADVVLCEVDADGVRLTSTSRDLGHGEVRQP
jgi:uncharacterized protein (DUF488 family)